ncbi:alpha/beta hydrolase [Aeromicrobium sp. CF3.5]|uniref:alpha/beta hydrolase n=1 Tax=Aeromicrobium sp. CF3.5 TaxID=3373078 RepID=UPI003EE6AFBE
MAKRISAKARRANESAARWTLVLAICWLAAAVLLAVLSRLVLLALHPAHAIALGVVALVGVLLLVRYARIKRRTAGPRHGQKVRVLGRSLAVVATLVVVCALVYLRPFGAAPEAVDAMAGTPAVQVDDSTTQIVLTPTEREPERGLVFQPGARVDPRAYVPMLTQVSRTGVLVAIIKQPLEIGFTAIGAPADIMDAHPDVTSWAVGGHSLGGVAASSYAGDHLDQIDGLVLWASYPLDSLADTSLAVTSISGTQDGLATPDDIEKSRPDLPESTVYVAIDGGVHRYFGDYGVQAGDGAPTTSRMDVQGQIVTATIALLQSM